ncbi:MAG: DUF485 domain-containing protein [Propionicimonas sp.]
MSEHSAAATIEEPEFHLPKDHWPLPELSLTEAPHRHPDLLTFTDVQRSAEYRKLRRSFTTFAFPTVVAVLTWYFLYVALSVFAEGFMSIPAIGHLNIGMVIGLLQFPTTWFATWLYVRRADTALDPMAAQLRSTIENEVAK